MSDRKEQQDTCRWDSSGKDFHTELCCCYVEKEDGTYENACAQEPALDECCC